MGIKMGRYFRLVLLISGVYSSAVLGQPEIKISSNDPMLSKKELKELIEKARGYLKIYPDSAIIIGRNIISATENIEDLYDVYLESISLIGYAYNQKSEFDKAIQYLSIFLKSIKNNLDSKTKLYSIMNLGSAYYYSCELDSALKYFTLAKNLNIINEDKLDMYICITIIGSIYYKKRQFGKAMDYHLKALDLILNHKLEGKLVETYYSIGSIYNAIAKYDKAIEYYLKAKKLLINEQGIMNAMILHAMGIVYEELKNYDEALKLNFLSYSMLNGDEDLNIKISCLNSIGSIYHKIGVIDSALLFINQAKILSDNYYDPQIVAITYNNLGNILSSKGYYMDAIKTLEKSFYLSENSKDEWRMAKVSMDIGRIYLKLNDYYKAEKYIYVGLKKSEKINAKNLILEGFGGLSEIYSLRSDYKTAFKYQHKFLKLQDILQIENSIRIADMQLRYETDKREKENVILRRNNSIQKLKIEKQKLIQTIQLLFLSIFIVLFGLLLHQYWLKNKLNKSLQQRIDDTIKRHHEQQQIIIHQAGLTSLGELAASIIHDILQPIQNIRLTADSALFSMKQKPKNVESILNMMNEIKTDVFRAEKIVKHIMIFARKHKQIEQDTFDVNESIKDAIRVTRRQLQSQKIIVEAILTEKMPLLKGNHFNFEQIMINLILNARDAIYQKRSKIPLVPGEIKIHSLISEQKIKILLTDNGVGIPDKLKVNIFKPFFTTKSGGVGTGLGLVIVKKMIQEIGGRIEYQSIQDKGTTVSISIPIKDDQKILERINFESH